MQKVEITPQIEKFNNHLDIPENYRIIFSGRFGSGKTHFLNEFFELEEQKYVQIRLTPVNYIVASNQDIFELIKFDILFELLKINKSIDGEDKIFEESEIEALIKLPYFVDNNVYDFAKFLVEKSQIVGEDVTRISRALIDIVEIINKVKDLKDNFKKFGTINEEKTAESYLREFEQKIGSIHEEDQFTNLICNCLIKFKSITSKKIILVIDDLDRIDPEHIFRLFNIFSAHIDLETLNASSLHNKFGFDKLIFVCDIENIRNIYHFKYGANVDFSGYIDKFYSKEIFKYDIIESLRRLLEDYVKRFNANFNGTKIEHYTGRRIIIYILEYFILSGFLNIRSLKDKIAHPFNTSPYDTPLKFSKNSGAYLPIIKSNELVIFDIIDFLIHIMGHSQKVMDSITIISDKKIFNENIDNMYISRDALGMLFPVLILHENIHEIPFPEDKLIPHKITFDIIKNEYIAGALVRNDNMLVGNCNEFNTNKNFFDLFKIAFSILRDKYGMYK